jgi:endoglucanase Acf2
MMKRHKYLFTAFGVLCLLSLAFGGFVFTRFVPMSGSSYSQTTPSHNLAPIVSNQWYSNIYAQFPTEPLYAEPSAYQLAPQGLGISLPDVNKTAHTIFAPYITDLRVGFALPLQKPVIRHIGDWSVTLAMATAHHESIQFTLAHGAPFTVLHVTGSALQLTCGVPCQVYINNTRLLAPDSPVSAQVFSLVIRGHTYIVSLHTALPVQLTGNTLTLRGTQRVYLAALPSRASYALFKRAATAEVLNTKATPTIDGNTVKTTYSLTTSGAVPLIALYPHQRAYLASAMPALGAYATIRGPLTLVQTNAFTTALPLKLPTLNFPKLRSIPLDLARALTSDIDTFISTGPPGSKDYGLGVWFGRGIDLLQLAQTLDNQAQEQRLLHYLEPQFTQSMQYFAYTPSKTSVLARYPEFGNENLNDHHFHYGYYIRAASVLAQCDPGYLTMIQIPVNEMVADIATTNRSSTQFPYLRNFDVYEGHSWADGYATFADGNDQESSSEAIQAWYGIYLWGQVTHNSSLTTTGLYLYTTEIVSVKEYWFGQNGLYTAPYQHAIASIVWGGKVDFATWFSSSTNAIYGIQLLPITPGSAYLGQLPAIAPYLADLSAHGGATDGYWGDLLLVWESYYAPSTALAQKDVVTNANRNISRSLFLYMLYAHAS